MQNDGDVSEDSATDDENDSEEASEEEGTREDAKLVSISSSIDAPRTNEADTAI